jgi:phage FluMu gp28-like protein
MKLFLILMAAVLSSPKIDRAERSGYFLPYQKDWILCHERKALCEKAVRVGWTFADAFKQVRKRLQTPKRDYLFVTKDQPTAFEYVDTAYRHLQIFNLTSSVLTHGTEEWSVPVFGEDGKDTGFQEKVTVGLIKLDNGSRIMAFSSNPNAVRAYGGDVGWDEAAFHPNARKMWAALQGRVRWGFDLGVWSSHHGDDTFFNQLCEVARDPGNGWAYFKCDIYRAIAEGLVEKINEVSGTEMTRAEFLESCRADAILPEIFAQEYELQPMGGLDAAVAWERLVACRDDYTMPTAHIADARVADLFGRPGDPGRKKAVSQWLRQQFPDLYDRSHGKGGRRWRIGFDVAASGRGHLAAVTVVQKAGPRYVPRAMVTFQTEDWDVMEFVVACLLSEIPGEVRGAGDETGLGRQICWRLASLYGQQFAGVNFSTAKKDLGTSLIAHVTDGSLRLPKDPDALIHDLHAVRKVFSNGRLVFLETKNPVLPESHCDLAWSLMLAIHADQRGVEPWVLSLS